MIKKTLCIILVIFMTLGFTACKEDNKIPTDNKDAANKLPDYSYQEFGLAGFWAPYEISEEGLKTYKDAGFNTLLMINHSLGTTSEEQFYLGSDRTMKSLEICKKLGLKAILNYNEWIALRCEEDGEEYYGKTPFTKHDVYGEYKDIITGIHICDEPKNTHFPIYGDQTLIQDFKKAYPNADYMVNLIPIYGAVSYGFDSFEGMLDDYDETFMSNFETPYISIDIYPFHTKVTDVKSYIIQNHYGIAKKAKETDAKTTFILQAAAGVEFEESLSEGDMRYQVNLALAFGADNLQYYCYSVPIGREYNYCILNSDNTPSELYYHVQKINREIQGFAPAYLSYDWDQAIGVPGTEDMTFWMGAIEYDENLDRATFKNAKHYVSAQGTQDLVISRFTSDDYGEAYMIANFSELDKKNSATITFKDCKEVAIYGGVGFDGEPKLVKLDEKGSLNLELVYGDGVFITPIKE